MALDPVRVAIAVKGGVSVVCATCPKYWEGRARNLPESQCTSTANCGSPLAEDDFSDYSGPITDFQQWCFVCGDLSTHGVKLRNKANPRTIGMCDLHVPWLAQMEAVDLDTSKPDYRLVIGPSGLITPEQLVKKRYKKTLNESIYEVEKYYADREGREFIP